MKPPSSARNFWIYAASISASLFGSQFQFLAVTSHTYAVTGSPLWTSLQMAISVLPHVLWARRAGKLADRADPRLVIAAANIAAAVLTLGYAFARHVAVMLCLNFLVTSVTVLLPPARAVLLPQIVGRDGLLQANARLASVRGAVLLIAPALAGSILVRTGVGWAFAFNSLSFLVPALAMAFLTPLAAPDRRTRSKRPPNFGLRAAWQFLRQQPALRRLLLGYGIYGLGMWSVNAIFYPYATDILKGGAEVVGWSISFYWGASIISGPVLLRWGQGSHGVRLLHVSYFLGAAAWAGYALTSSIPVALLLSAFDGFVFTYASTLYETKIQQLAPDESRGQLFALARAYDETTNVAGQLAGGLLASRAGIVPGLGWSAGLTAGLVAVVLILGRRPVTQGASTAPPV